MVGPTYGFFGLGLCLYFASQGAGRLLWPLLAGLLRMLLAIGGGWLALRLTGSLTWVFAGAGRGAGRLWQHAAGRHRLGGVVSQIRALDGVNGHADSAVAVGELGLGLGGRLGLVRRRHSS